MSRMPLHLMTYPDDVSVVRLAPDAEPGFDWEGAPFASITRTKTECSVICPSALVPAGATTIGPYRPVEVAGPLDPFAVGVFVEILTPLAEAGITILGLSTHDTDWVFVPSARFDDALTAWRKAGLIVTPTVLPGGSA